MGREVTFDYSKAAGFIAADELSYMKAAVMGAKDVLTSKSGAGNDFLGWIDLPVDCDKEEFIGLKSQKSAFDSDVLLVIGIGGSLFRRRSFRLSSYPQLL